MSKIIAITGLAGAGKDTSADHLVEQHGYVKVAFATPIKKALNLLFDWNMELWDDRAWKEAVQEKYGKSPRQLAQSLGTEWGRKLVTEDLWCFLTEAEFSKHDKVVCCDLRRDNEARFLTRKGASIIEVIRPGITQMAHESESGISMHYKDYLVYNEFSIPQLKKRIDEMLAEIP